MGQGSRTSMGYDRKGNYKQKRGKLSSLMTEEDKKKAGIYLVHG